MKTAETGYYCGVEWNGDASPPLGRGAESVLETKRTALRGDVGLLEGNWIGVGRSFICSVLRVEKVRAGGGLKGGCWG